MMLQQHNTQTNKKKWIKFWDDDDKCTSYKIQTFFPFIYTFLFCVFLVLSKFENNFCRWLCCWYRIVDVCSKAMRNFYAWQINKCCRSKGKIWFVKATTNKNGDTKQLFLFFFGYGFVSLMANQFSSKPKTDKFLRTFNELYLLISISRPLHTSLFLFSHNNILSISCSRDFTSFLRQIYRSVIVIKLHTFTSHHPDIHKRSDQENAIYKHIAQCEMIGYYFIILCVCVITLGK